MFPYLISHIMDRISRSSSYLFLTLTLTLTLSFAYAGEYHAIKEKTAAKTTESLVCSQCHTMHGTQGSVSLIYDESTRGYGGPTAAVYTKLLRQSSILNLCLFCHHNDGASMSAPDVWDGDVANPNPSAGLLCSGGGSPPCSDGSTNHTIDVNAIVTVPGSSPAITFDSTTGGFTCVNCHNPHGTTNYRNLRNSSYGGVDFTGVDVSYAYNTSVNPNDNTKYVNNWLSGTSLTKFQTSNVTFRKSPTASATDGIQAFCKACHTKFHYYSGENSTEMGGAAGGGVGAGDTGTPWLRHPTSDVSMTQGGTNLHVDYTNWTSALTWRPRIVDTDGAPGTADDQPFCLSCHRAHGSSRHSNLIYGTPDSVGGSNEASTAMMRDTCQQCHNQ